MKCETIPNLKIRGWKSKSYNSLMSYKKVDLVEKIRCLEHNWSGEIWKCNLLQKRLENACDYLKEQGLSLDKINKIISVEREYRK